MILISDGTVQIFQKKVLRIQNFYVDKRNEGVRKISMILHQLYSKLVNKERRGHKSCQRSL